MPVLNVITFHTAQGHGCLAMADATGAQATERFGKNEKAPRLAF